MYGGSRDEALYITFFQYKLTFSFTYTGLCEY